MIMITIYSLTKTTALSSLYRTNAAKVDVLLHKWGIADKFRLRAIRTNLQSKR